MSQWVSNIIKVDHRMSEISEYVKSSDSNFDFEKILPMPSSFKGLASVGYADMDIVYFLSERFSFSKEELKSTKSELIKKIVNSSIDINPWIEQNYEHMRERIPLLSYDELDETYERGRRYVENQIQYGAKDWYEWCTKNWGTKWNCDYIYSDDKMFIIQTVDTIPKSVLQSLSEKFPDVIFSIDFAGEELGENCGSYELKNGETTQYEIKDGDFKFACEVWGLDYKEEQSFRESNYSIEAEIDTEIPDFIFDNDLELER